ncbi:MAG TPA: methyltransferase domain-containing protein [Candidatus Limnocylindria bacterium]|nr:methyltransferase domain-containing protein [Candidatus Limnocylindria bacterium]
MRERTKQVEYFDGLERTPEELRGHYAALARLNRVIRFERPFRFWLPQILGEVACAKLSFLDLGAADGFLGRQLSAWATERGWDWQFTNLDLCPFTAELDPNERHVTASVTALPFPDGSFDVVTASMMTHHLNTDDEVVTHFREAVRVARRAVLICDLHRNPFFLTGLWLLMQCLDVPREFRRDGATSVRRGWRVPEWQRFVRQAGLEQAQVWFEHGTRILLSVVK